MNRFLTVISLLFVTTFVHSLAVSQTIALDPGETPLSVLMTPIQQVSEQVLPPIRTNLRGRVGIDSSHSLSNDGRIMRIGKDLILAREMVASDFTRISDTQILNGFKVSGDGEWLLRQTRNEMNQSIVQFYNSGSLDLVYEHNTLTSALGSFAFNDDATVFRFNSDQPRQVHVVERKDSVFTSVVLINEGGAVNLSAKGDRVFFYGGNVHQGFRYLQFDRLLDGWSEPRELVLRDEQGQAFDFAIRDIANNGRTILFITGTWSDFDLDRKLGIVHENGGVWSIPQFLDFNLVLGRGNNYSISEDGKVVAVQSAVTDLGNSSHSDIFVFIQSPKGEWVKHQVNPPGVLSLSGMLLTKDGTKLFWMPTSNFLSNAPFAP